MLICSICGGREFRDQPVLWDALVAEWRLTRAERAYVDRQQGTNCAACGANLRIIALTNAVRDALGIAGSLREAIADGALTTVRTLDCNGAEALSATLAALPHYIRADYPEVDMRALPYADASFDLVVHSDTLEHIERPEAALAECRRVLAPGGRLCFTVPIIVGRMTADRAELPLSFHGDPATTTSDFAVRTEYGADAWTSVMAAGFTDVTLTTVEYPAAIAMCASVADVMLAPAPPPPPLPAPPTPEAGLYDQDGLRSIHNHDFMHDPAFTAAYARGVVAADEDYRWHWRVHVGLWAARAAQHLAGDFIEFGVNRGFMSSAMMELLDWDTTGRTFWLLDTFAGVDARYLNDDDLALGVLDRNRDDIDRGFYTFDTAAVAANFAQWTNVRIIAGPVPETLSAVTADRIALVHLDMNCALPEVAAAEWAWPRLVPGGIMLLDDYAYRGFESQKLAMDAFARDHGVSVLSLPTGQGLIVRPPDPAPVGQLVSTAGLA